MKVYLEGFCQSPLWDTGLTWNTTSPDLTACFQNTLLVWLPCGALWILAPFELYRILNTRSGPNPWSFGCILKTMLSFVFMVATVSAFGRSVYVHFNESSLPPVEHTARAIEMASLLLAFFLILESRRNGCRVSMVLPVFWLLFTASSAIRLYSHALKKGADDTFNFVVLTVYTILSGVMLLLSSFPDAPSAFQRLEDEESTCPLRNVPFFSRLTFFWMMSTLFRGGEEKIQQHHLANLCEEMTSEVVSDAFDAAYYRRDCKKLDSDYPKKKKRRRSILSCLWRTNRGFVISGCLLEMVAIGFSFVPPVMVRILLDFLSSDEVRWHGVVYSIVISLSIFIGGVAGAHSMYFLEVASIRIKSALTSAIYRKILRLRCDPNQRYSPSEIINLMSVDTTEIFELAIYVCHIWGVPIRIALCLYFLWQYLGPACLAGLAVMAVMVPLTTVIARKCDKYQEKEVAMRDLRIKQIREMIKGIKILKLYAWEEPFMDRVTKIRNKELHYQRHFQCLEAIFSLMWVVAPMIVAFCSFLFFTYISEAHHVLDAKTVFVSLTLFNLLRFPMGVLPDVFSRLIRTKLSLRRIQAFMESEELEMGIIGQNPLHGHSVCVKGASFCWSSFQDPVLKEINLHVPQGSLVCVVGAGGSGKTALLLSLLGELHRPKGSVDLKGSVAYVPQQAWIQNATLRNNIIFTQEADHHQYQCVLEACCLNKDVAELPGGDLTELGAKDISLSESQKQRINLARAVYQNADLYLLDDPLSPMEPQLARSVFERVIGQAGILKDKTRILCTQHHLSMLSEADFIVLLDRGRIADRGTYSELVQRGGIFAELLSRSALRSSTKEKPNRRSSISPPRRRKRPTSLRLDRTVEIKKGYTGGVDRTKGLSRMAEDEQLEVGKIHLDAYVRYARNMGVCTITVLIGAYFLMNGCEIGAGFWLSDWVNHVTVTFHQRNNRAIVYCLVMGVQVLLLLFCSVLLGVGAARASAKLHRDLMNSVMKAKLTFFDVTPVSRILNRFARDMDIVDVAIPTNMGFFTSTLMWTTLAFLTICGASVYFVIGLIVILTMYYLIQKLYILTNRQLTRLNAVSLVPIYSNFSESIPGASSIRAYKSQDFFIRRCFERVDLNLNYHYQGMSATRWLTVWLVIVGSVIVFTAAMLLVLQKEIILTGLAGLALVYSLEVTDGVSWLIRVATDLENNIDSLERVQEYTDLQSEAPWELSDRRPPHTWPFRGAVSFRNYSTAYRDGVEPVLRNINLDIQPREKIGILGARGSGKTSLALSLFRILEPTEGTIVIDGIDITKIGLHELRERLTLVPKDPILFPGTIRMNLDPWDDNSDTELWTALEQAHLKEFVCELPEGLLYNISEGGGNLSVSQKQLLCLARALLRETRVLVLDDITSVVDPETDRLIHDTIRTSCSSSTVIVIAHRVHSVLDCDRVVVLSGGQIIEEGKPQSLLSDQTSAFHAMAKEAGLL